MPANPQWITDPQGARETNVEVYSGLQKGTVAVTGFLAAADTARKESGVKGAAAGAVAGAAVGYAALALLGPVGWMIGGIATAAGAVYGASEKD